ncbi:unnamed protein product [Anisakis simplex]|uniref:Ig-like domain-containing protein n=1 Tax=Anisakis simplex TaxID=6269 RepID=A0A0M3J2M8_ANISI|nr:unnamed protein product [Anisakis simplex]
MQVVVWFMVTQPQLQRSAIMSEQEPGHGGDVNPPKKDWVHFDEQSEQGEEKNEENREMSTNQVDQTTPPPQITPQSIVIDASKLLESSGYATRSGAKANGGTPPTDPESPTVVVPKEDEPFSAYRNGKIICAVYPENTTMAWVVPARYNPYSMPRSLADDRLKLPSEDYVTAMEMITNDYRFRCDDFSFVFFFSNFNIHFRFGRMGFLCLIFAISYHLISAE